LPRKCEYDTKLAAGLQLNKHIAVAPAEINLTNQSKASFNIQRLYFTHSTFSFFHAIQEKVSFSKQYQAVGLFYRRFRVLM
jgi:hypothetical protein